MIEVPVDMMGVRIVDIEGEGGGGCRWVNVVYGYRQ